MPRNPSTQAPRRLDRLADNTLLALRFKDLPVSIESSNLQDRLHQLHSELAERNITLKPHAWLSDEWFAPTDVPGIALPFYLAHPRLIRLERRMMLEAEGATRDACMKLLRHEAGHCVRVAYNLQRRRAWQNTFGSAAKPYPASYKPRPYSRAFVQHLDNYYAQAHPDEDFAETFAVWLTPGYNWRRRYANWPALKKLEYVDDLMREIAGHKPKTRSRKRIAPIERLDTTLREHYDARRAAYGVDQPDIYLRDLRALFTTKDQAPRGSTKAAAALRKHRRPLVRAVARWTNQYPYTIDTIYNAMIERCHADDLRVPPGTDHDALHANIASLLTVLAMNEIQTGGRRIRI